LSMDDLSSSKNNFGRKVCISIGSSWRSYISKVIAGLFPLGPFTCACTEEHFHNPHAVYAAPVRELRATWADSAVPTW
jgi:hypothetical protein